jgi:hypothetical protein
MIFTSLITQGEVSFGLVNFFLNTHFIDNPKASPNKLNKEKHHRTKYNINKFDQYLAKLAKNPGWPTIHREGGIGEHPYLGKSFAVKENAK